MPRIGAKETMTIDVKICGVSTVEALDAALAARATFFGLVFHRPSPRNVSLETAAHLATRARDRIRSVVLLVDPDDDRIDSIVAVVAPDIIQLHGSETPARVQQVRSRSGRPVLKAIRVATDADVAAAARYDSADMILFDAQALPGALPGGNGLSFDWTLLAPWRGRRFILAGGLTASNVADAIRLTGATGVDVSSGVESRPGVKDARLITEFIAAARAA